MSEAAIRAAIKTVLEAVTGIGPVHDYERYSRSLAIWLELMRPVSGLSVHGWVCHRESSGAMLDTMPTVHRTHRYRITGIYELDDATATEKTFQALIELIFAAFLVDTQLGGVCESVEPLDIQDVSALEYQNKLYHVADCLLIVHERATYA